VINLAQLWLPIVLSGIGIFVASSVIHMLLKWHSAEYGQIGNEDAVRVAINAGQPKPGQYMLPYCTDPKQFGEPDMKRKLQEGPVGIIVLKPPGMFAMGPMLLQWFVYVTALSFVVGYLAAHSLGAGAPFLHVFRLVWTVAYLAFLCGSIQNAIWMGKPWKHVMTDALDAAIYGAVSGALFGWLWPH
jgi:hypothetical protein